MDARTKLLESQIKGGKKELLSSVASARKNIEAKIIKYAERGDFIKAATVRDGLYRGIAEEYVKLNAGVDDWTKKQSTKTAKAWHALAVDDLPSGAKATTFGQFSEKYLDDIVGKINPTTIGDRVAMSPRIEGMLSEDVRAIRTAVTETIREGALTGMSNRELTAEMIKKATAIKPTAQFIDKAGRTWNSESYFGMLNRTLHANVARETYADTVVEAGFDLMRVEGGVSTGEADDPCNQYVDAILSMTGATPGYPTVAEATANGLFHPNCVHSLSVVDPDEVKK